MPTRGNSHADDVRRQLPSVDRLLRSPALVSLIATHGRGLTLRAARETLAMARQDMARGMPAPSVGDLTGRVIQQMEAWLRPTLQPVINATGVIIHTNLGRAPLSENTRRAMHEAGAGYSNLEFDLESGQRGSRYLHAEALLCRLTGAEAALVVNNNAAAVLLSLSTLAAGREVILSRGHLVEIGGGFRVPEVMAQSGARLVEVGTTNRTHLQDYEKAITPETALLLRVHPSNFKQIGFVAEPSLAELVALGRQHGLPVMDDLGSGTLLDTSAYGLAAEPTVQASVQGGAALVTFSGDKLLGGPQAGIIIGQREFVARLRQHPLARALRVDKVTLAGVQANLLHYAREEATQEIPIWRMITLKPETIAQRADGWAASLREAGIMAGVVAGHSTVGGGSLPGETLPTYLLALTCPSPERVAAQLRQHQPPIIARLAADRLLLDPRTVALEEETALLDALRGLKGKGL